MEASAQAATYSGRTAWARNLAAPVRDFLTTETGGAVVLVAAVVAALIWANSSPASYDSVWTTQLSIRLGGGSVSLDLRHWVNEGLMSLFFLVVGLEVKRELQLGELRERSRVAIPVFAAVGGGIVPIAIYLALNAGGSGGHGWGAAMSTDTAFSLGALALIVPRTATRLRVFLLTLAVFDDLVALIIIATVYAGHVSFPALGTAAGLFALLLGLRYAPVGRGPASIAVAVAFWVALYKSGIDPVISGLAVGLVTSAYPPSRRDLERATELGRAFREQPTPALARSAQQGLVSAISPNERIQYDLHPWTSYVIVPLFAVANAGIHVTSKLLGDAISSPITLGIAIGYIVGKPVGILGASWLASRLRIARLPVSLPVVAIGGATAGIGFTVSVLIASLAFSGEHLDEARLGALATVVLAPIVALACRTALNRLPRAVRARQIRSTAEELLDLAEDVDPERDHVRGPDDAIVTLVEYGDFECPYCGMAEPVIRELLSSFGADLRYVWRHLPLNDVHANAQAASEAAEAAAAQDRFWDYYDALLSHQEALHPDDLERYAEELGLDTERFADALRRRKYAERVGEDVASADESGVTGTPTFFINGRRHYGVYDADTLRTAVQAAKNRAGLLRSPVPSAA